MTKRYAAAAAEAAFVLGALFEERADEARALGQTRTAAAYADAAETAREYGQDYARYLARGLDMPEKSVASATEP